MVSLTEDISYKLWGMDTNRSWESLYTLLDEDLVYNLMQIAQRFQSNEAQFPQTHDQFYETLSKQLPG